MSLRGGMSMDPAREDQSQPPRNPARRKPVRMYGQSRIRRQISPVRWFSIIMTTMPWSSPKWPGDTQARPSASARLGLKLLAYRDRTASPDSVTHLARGVERDVRRERQRCKRRPAGEGPIVRSVRHAARRIAEQAPRLAGHAGQLVARAITRRQAPAVFVVTGEFVRVALRVFALDKRRAPAVLEVVAALLAHEAILDAAKIDPRMRELVHEQRPAVQEIVAVQVLPLVGRGPCVVAVAFEGMRRRAQREHVEHDRLVVALPAVVQESAFGLPALPERLAAVLRPSPVDAPIQHIDQFAQLDFVAAFAVKYMLAVSAPAISSAVSIIDSSERQTRAPVCAVEEVVVEALVAGRLGAAALIAVAEETQRGEAALHGFGARDPAALHRHRIARQRESDHRDADRRIHAELSATSPLAGFSGRRK